MEDKNGSTLFQKQNHTAKVTELRDRRLSESVLTVQTVKRKTLQKIASKKKNQVEKWR